ncbi:hypothetical protein H5T87_04940 [bacterium]|nr:hypothetical protein [bacterium]
MVECKFCGAENPETKEACWNCFAPLKGGAAAAMQAAMARITEAVPPAEGKAVVEAPAIKVRKRGFPLGLLVGVIIILIVGGGGFFFYSKIFREKPQQVAKDFINAFVQSLVSQDLSTIKPYIDPVDAANLPTTKEDFKKKVLQYLRSMGVNVSEKVGGMDIMDLVATIKPTVQSLNAQTESASFSEAKVRVQVVLSANTSALPIPVSLPSLQGSVTLTLVRQGLDWKVSLNKSFPSQSPLTGKSPMGKMPFAK